MLRTMGERIDRGLSMKEFNKMFDQRVEGFKKIKRKELEFSEIKREKAPKSTSHKHLYIITLNGVKQ